MGRFAVTAVSGQLGAEVVRVLAQSVGSSHVVGFARTPAKAIGLGVDVRPGDYDDCAGLERSLQGVEAMLLVSGMDAPDKRIGQHRNVIAAAVAAGVRKIVYTSIHGPAEGTAFSPIVASNRQTERDVQASGLAWAVGRNGIYIEPDVEYIGTYQAAGEIANCAGDGLCGYTTRPELAAAYARLLTDDETSGRSYRLYGEPLSQGQLAHHLGTAFGTPLHYRNMSLEDYAAGRRAELGEFMGTVVAGIYQGIRDGAYAQPGEYAAAAGRPHQTWDAYFGALARAHAAGG